MSGNARYDVSMRLRAVELYEQGRGRDKIASLLGMSSGTVREWLAVYRSVGIEVLAMTGGKHATYSFETKLAAVRAVVDEGMTKPAAMARFGITSTTSLKTWLRAYREGGPGALRPKPKGRHKGTSSPPKKTTREQELERRVRKLEAENACLKKSIALKAEKRSRTAIRRSSWTGFQGSILSPTCSSAPASPGQATTTRCRTRRLRPGPSCAGRSRRSSRARRAAAATGRWPCACAPSWARVADKTVLKMMREMGVSCGIRRETGCHRYNSYRGVVGETFENVIGRDFAVDGPWQKMGTDVTEFKQPWGKAYFAPVYDFGSKEIVAWSTSLRPNMAQQHELLDQLVSKKPKGSRPILHSDMGWQYQHAGWCKRLEEAGVVQSMSRKGNCIDNGATEQAFGHLKDEFFRGRSWPDFESFKADLDAYVVHWNTRRRQVKLKGLTPEEFRSQSLVA